MDKVPNGIEPMLKDLEEHIISAGLADMVAAAETITTVSFPQWQQQIHVIYFLNEVWVLKIVIDDKTVILEYLLVLKKNYSENFLNFKAIVFC